MRTLLAALVTAVLVGGLAVAAADEDGPDAAHPVIVDGERIAAAALAPRADRAIEAAWLAGEARDRRLPAAIGAARSPREVALLRAAVADAVAVRATTPARFVAAFEAFHHKWRGRTRCLASVHDPYTDRCSDHAPAAEGACRWMGAASLCELRASGDGWLIVRAGERPRRVRSRRRAAAAVMRIHELARTRRERLARHARAQRERAERRERAAAERTARQATDAARRARLAAERRRRLAEPALSPASLAAAERVCDSYDRAIDPYRFGAGLQDLEGQAEGFRAARSRAARGLPRAAADAIDARKLRQLLSVLRLGDRALAAMGAAAAAGDLEGAYARLAQFDALARREARLAARLGLRECLESPTR